MRFPLRKWNCCFATAQQKCQEQHRLFLTFADVTKAFDTVTRESSWKIWRTLAAHNDRPTMFWITETASFPVTNGVKQGCFLAATLFSMVFSVMLADTFWKDGIPVK